MKKSLCTLLMLLCLLAGSQLALALPDPGIPDTMSVSGGPLIVGESVPLSFTIQNDEELSGFFTLLKMNSVNGGFAKLDSLVYVNRLADPTVANFRIFYPFIDGVSPDSFAAYCLNAGGATIPPGNSPVISLYFTGIAQGNFTIGPYALRTGELPSVNIYRPSGGSYLKTVALPTVSMSVIIQPDLPFINLPQTITRSAAGNTIQIPIAYGSTQGLETSVEVESIVGADDDSVVPSTTPVFIDDGSPRVEWESSIADLGIWNLTLKATDSQNNVGFATIEIQLVANQQQLLAFEFADTPSDVNSTSLGIGNFDSDPEFELFSTGGAFAAGPGAALYEFSASGLDREFSQDTYIHKNGARLGFIDGDDNLDVFLTSWVGGYSVQSYLGAGNNNLEKIQGPLIGTFACGATLGEFTGDSHIDYAITAFSTLVIFPSNGNGTFGEAISLPVFDTALSLNSADFNSDGRDDLALGTRRGIRIYNQTPFGQFDLVASYPQDYGTVDIDITNSGSDFNSDGKFDLCIATPSVGGARSEMLVYFGNGDGTFVPTEVRDINGQILASCVADFNGDTKLDIAFVNGASRYVGIIFGDGLGNFDSELRYPIPTLRPRLLESVDYDLDGDLDLVVAASGIASENSFFLLTNQSDPPGYSVGQLEVNAQDNAQITITAPGGGQLSEVCNSIPASSMYKRDLNGNEMLDSYASLGVVESGEYLIRVTPKPNLPIESTFGLEYSYGNQNFRLAGNCPMTTAGYEFGVPLDANAVLPRPGSFVGASIGNFKWQGSGQFDFQLATDIGFQQIVTTQVVSGNTLPYSSGLGFSDTTGYFWRVKQVGASEYGKIYSFNVTGTATAAEDETQILPFTYSLAQNYPNPFNPSTRIEFTMARAGQASIRIANILGETVATLLDEFTPAGNHVVEWRGLDQSGRAVPSGVYFYTLKAGDYTNVRKMVLLK